MHLSVLERVLERVTQLHREAWQQHDNYERCLTEAVSLCQVEYARGERSPLFMNNYAAVLMDLHRDDEALGLLQFHKPDFSEHCANLAIATAKAAYDLEGIRKWNGLASQLPRRKGANVAYMDWQAL